MATKVKVFLKKYITQIFVYKEHEMEIGYPTDVKHVAHIGWDRDSLNAPSWMNEFRTTSDFSLSSLGTFGQSRETSWASEDFDHPRGFQSFSGINPMDVPRPDVPKPPKKSKKRMKAKKIISSLSSTSSMSIKSQSSYETAMEDSEEALK